MGAQEAVAARVGAYSAGHYCGDARGEDVLTGQDVWVEGGGDEAYLGYRVGVAGALRNLAAFVASHRGAAAELLNSWEEECRRVESLVAGERWWWSSCLVGVEGEGWSACAEGCWGWYTRGFHCKMIKFF